MVSGLDALNKVLVLNYNVLPPNKIPRRNAGLFFYVDCHCETLKNAATMSGRRYAIIFQVFASVSKAICNRNF